MDIQKFKTVYDALNEQQKEAVNIYNDNLLIVAGAGTGKTSTITSRMAYLIYHVCAPENILAVTFTNKAAQEMKRRAINLTYPETNKMIVGTFHGVSLKILRAYGSALNLQENFLILDEYDKKKLLSGVIKDLGIDETKFPVKVCQFIISQLKNKCISHEDEEKIATFQYKDLDIVNLYQTYQSRLRAMNAVDFDDLIFECVKLFKKRPDILKHLQDKFKYITVDEYQDTNEIQHLWLRLLAGSNNNVCCVGDEDQSIYAWRGAKVDYILNFENDFPGAKIIRLEQNYRSTQSILKAAMNVISNNIQRYQKNLRSQLNTTDLPNLVKVESDRDENNHMVKTIKTLQQNGTPYRDMAILVRATHQMRSIEDCFIKNSVPYKIIGGIKFYERKEIKDIVAYIRWCYSLTDIISLERIINIPKRGIGEKSFNDIMSYIAQNNWELADGLQNVSNFGNILSKKSSENLRSFLEFSFTIHNQLLEKEIPMSDIIEKIYFNSGYGDMLQNEIQEDPENTSRIENIKELISSAKQFDNIEQFLEHISLMSASDDVNETDSVNIMTMHASKGLEFDYVFLPAWEEGMFPSQKSVDENGEQGVEEERRLAYVALTRAKINFYVYTAKQRFLFGRPQLSSPSRFINEMMKDSNTLKTIDLTYNISTNQLTGSYGKTFISKPRFSKTFHSEESIEAKQQLTSGVSRKKNLAYISGASQYQTTNYYAEQEKKEKTFKVGDRVYSEKHGNGIVKMVYGKFYEVQFENTKQITKDIVKIEEE